MNYYFYKIVNLINGKFYYGVHSTDDLNDGYMGSGLALKRAYKKHGIQNFQKQILNFFNSKEECSSMKSNLLILSLLKTEIVIICFKTPKRVVSYI